MRAPRKVSLVKRSPTSACTRTATRGIALGRVVEVVVDGMELTATSIWRATGVRLTRTPRLGLGVCEPIKAWDAV
jgi:hypothetical protein